MIVAPRVLRIRCLFSLKGKVRSGQIVHYFRYWIKVRKEALELFFIEWQAIEARYAKGETDEFLKPIIVNQEGTIRGNHWLAMTSYDFNFRFILVLLLSRLKPFIYSLLYSFLHLCTRSFIFPLFQSCIPVSIHSSMSLFFCVDSWAKVLQ